MCAKVEREMIKGMIGNKTENNEKKNYSLFVCQMKGRQKKKLRYGNF